MQPGTWGDWAAAAASLFVGIVAAVIALHQQASQEARAEAEHRHLLREAAAMIELAQEQTQKVASHLADVCSWKDYLAVSNYVPGVQAAFSTVEHYLQRHPRSALMVISLVGARQTGQILLPLLTQFERRQLDDAPIGRDAKKPQRGVTPEEHQSAASALKDLMPQLRAMREICALLRENGDLGYIPPHPPPRVKFGTIAKWIRRVLPI